MKEKKEVKSSKRGAIKDEMYKMFDSLEIGDSIIVKEPFTKRKQGTNLRSYIVSYAKHYAFNEVGKGFFKIKTKVVDGCVQVTRVIDLDVE